MEEFFVRFLCHSEQREESLLSLALRFFAPAQNDRDAFSPTPQSLRDKPVGHSFGKLKLSAEAHSLGKLKFPLSQPKLSLWRRKTRASE